jgi:hypothetical protein
VARKSVEFRLRASPEDSIQLCRDVVRERQWDLISISPGKLVARQKTRLTSYSVKVSVEMTPSAGGTEVLVNGQVLGWGLNSRACREAVEGLRDTLIYEDSHRRNENT